MPTSGYVYVLINPAMKGLVKIGRTTDSSESRARQISSATGVPMEFVVAFEVKVSDVHEVERRAHSQLSAYRVTESREFFRVGLKTVISMLMALEGEFAVQVQKHAPACNGSIEDLIFGSRQSGSPSGAGATNNRDAGRVSKEEPSFGPHLVRDLVAAEAALASGDAEEMIAAIKRLGGRGEMAQKLCLAAAKLGRADVCAELARAWPEHGERLLQKLSLLWIAASAGDAAAAKELSSYWHLLQADSREQMRQFARKLNTKFECKDL